jgi:hypothetical protein
MSATPPGGARDTGRRGARRWWPAVALAVVVLVGAVVVILLQRGPGPEREPVATATPAPATPSSAGPTAPTATPTEDTRSVSTQPLAERLGTDVVDIDDPDVRYTLTDPGWVPDEDTVAAGAREAVTGTLTDGSDDVDVTAAAFDTIAAQDAHAEEAVARLAQDATLLSDGTVYSDGSGRHWAYLLADGETVTVLWRTDDGVVLTVTGPREATETVYGNMSL